MKAVLAAAFILLALFGLRPAEAETRVALVIANAAYAGSVPPLANPVNDARLVAGALERSGFKVSLVTDADQRKMKKAIVRFGEALAKAGPTATALFYFAGHGLQVGGENFLVPIGADIEREGDVDLEAISAEAVLKQMEYAAVATNIVILDACRNNPLSRSFRSGTRGLARMDAPNGSFVAYSTAPGDVAADGTGANSPFASALAGEIAKPGQAIEETFRNVRISVAKATGGMQTPWDSSSLMGPFYFVPRGEGPTTVAEVAAIEPGTRAATGLAPEAVAGSWRGENNWIIGGGSGGNVSDVYQLTVGAGSDPGRLAGEFRIRQSVAMQGYQPFWVEETVPAEFRIDGDALVMSFTRKFPMAMTGVPDPGTYRLSISPDGVLSGDIKSDYHDVVGFRRQ